VAPFDDPFLSSEEAARQIGMSPEWVRRQVRDGRLRARVFVTGERSTIRIRRSWLADFLSAYSYDSIGADDEPRPAGRGGPSVIRRPS
jgi:excisionase family DNA binding protein